MSKKRTLSILNSVDVKSPCHESWDEMCGGRKSRHCDKCDHAVNNLSEMTAHQAARLLKQHQGKHLCVRYSINSKGEINFRPRFSLVSSAWRSASLFLATGFALLGIVSTASADCTDKSVEESSCNSREVTMGKIAPAETPAPARTGEPILMGEIAPVEDTPASIPNQSDASIPERKSVTDAGQKRAHDQTRDPVVMGGVSVSFETPPAGTPTPAKKK